jgi:hypothetical protein
LTLDFDHGGRRRPSTSTQRNATTHSPIIISLPRKGLLGVVECRPYISSIAAHY